MRDHDGLDEVITMRGMRTIASRSHWSSLAGCTSRENTIQFRMANVGSRFRQRAVRGGPAINALRVPRAADVKAEARRVRAPRGALTSESTGRPSSSPALVCNRQDCRTQIAEQPLFP